MNDQLQATFLGYATVLPAARQMNIHHSSAKYVLLPVWILNTRYNGRIYTFAMNGQTGKLIGDLPISAKRFWGWFLKISVPLTLILSFIGSFL